MRPRRFLLLTTALGSTALIAACKKEASHEPPPGNPKGTIYDNGTSQPPPANPKGSFYDAGVTPTPPPTVGAETTPSGGADAGTTTIPKPPPSAKATVGPGPTRLPGNPKGSHYDAGKKP